MMMSGVTSSKDHSLSVIFAGTAILQALLVLASVWRIHRDLRKLPLFVSQ
jgi:hypothetical protein